MNSAVMCRCGCRRRIKICAVVDAVVSHQDLWIRENSGSGSDEPGAYKKPGARETICNYHTGFRVRLYSEILLQERSYLSEEHHTGVAHAQTVFKAHVGHHVKQLSFRREFGSISQSIIEMHIVIISSAHNEQRDVEMFGARQGRSAVITLLVLTRGQHESFGVDGIIETPV